MQGGVSSYQFCFSVRLFAGSVCLSVSGRQNKTNDVEGVDVVGGGDVDGDESGQVGGGGGIRAGWKKFAEEVPGAGWVGPELKWNAFKGVARIWFRGGGGYAPGSTCGREARERVKLGMCIRRAESRSDRAGLGRLVCRRDSQLQWPGVRRSAADLSPPSPRRSHLRRCRSCEYRERSLFGIWGGRRCDTYYSCPVVKQCSQSWEDLRACLYRAPIHM